MCLSQKGTSYVRYVYHRLTVSFPDDLDSFTEIISLLSVCVYIFMCEWGDCICVGVGVGAQVWVCLCVRRPEDSSGKFQQRLVTFFWKTKHHSYPGAYQVRYTSLPTKSINSPVSPTVGLQMCVILPGI